MLEYHSNCPFPDLWGISFLCTHAPILSRVGASGKAGAVQVTRLDVVNYIAHSISINTSSHSSGAERSQLENIESKVDQLLGELRDLSEKVQQISDRLGPEEKS